MSLDLRARVKGGVLLIFVSMCLLSGYRLSSEARHRQPQSLDDRRFDGVRKMLPERGVVGYFSDRQGDTAGYFMTQYELAPLVIDNSTDHHFVVGNLSDVHPAIPIRQDWVLVRDFGNGVVLIENRGK